MDLHTLEATVNVHALLYSSCCETAMESGRTKPKRTRSGVQSSEKLRKSAQTQKRAKLIAESNDGSEFCNRKEDLPEIH